MMASLFRDRSGTKRYRFRFVATLLLLLAPSARAAQDPTPTEYELKAVLLYNFSKFVEWPPESFPEVNSPFRICVLGRDPFAKSFASLQSKSVGARQLQIVRLSSRQAAPDCHILFLSGSEKNRLPSLLDLLGNKPVLTVGDTEGFAAAGVIINFVLEEDRVRFEVNVQAADRAHLAISSRLLASARTVIHSDKRKQP
jgi:YfiR/HmsC-like